MPAPTPDPTGPVLHVGLGVDPAYAPHAAVVVRSLVRCHPHRGLHVHVLTPGLGHDQARGLEAAAADHPHHHLHIHRFRDGAFGLPGFARFSEAVHLRFLLPDVVPDDCPRVLYLDADVVVMDDLSPLWTLELDGATAAAAEDDTRRFQLRRLAGRGLSTYLNSGVVLVDVERWRSREATRRIVETIRAEGSALAMPDQDGLNLALRDELAILPRRWNVQRPTFFDGRRVLGLEAREHRALIRRPGIVHFTDFSKPWHATDQHPLGGVYRRLRQETVFADPSLESGRSRGTRWATALKAALLRTSPELLPSLRRLRQRLAPRADDGDPGLPTAPDSRP